MPRGKKVSAEQIIGKLREAEVEIVARSALSDQLSGGNAKPYLRQARSERGAVPVDLVALPAVLFFAGTPRVAGGPFAVGGARGAKQRSGPLVKGHFLPIPGHQFGPKLQGLGIDAARVESAERFGGEPPGLQSRLHEFAGIGCRHVRGRGAHRRFPRDDVVERVPVAEGRLSRRGLFCCRLFRTAFSRRRLDFLRGLFNERLGRWFAPRHDTRHGRPSGRQSGVLLSVCLRIVDFSRLLCFGLKLRQASCELFLFEDGNPLFERLDLGIGR